MLTLLSCHGPAVVQILDPTRPLEENVDRLGMDYNWLPPEMDPQGFPDYLMDANSPVKQFEHQVCAAGGAPRCRVAKGAQQHHQAV